MGRPRPKRKRWRRPGPARKGRRRGPSPAQKGRGGQARPNNDGQVTRDRTPREDGKAYSYNYNYNYNCDYVSKLEFCGARDFPNLQIFNLKFEKLKITVKIMIMIIYMPFLFSR